MQNLLQEIRDGDMIYTAKPKILGNPISREVANTLTDMLTDRLQTDTSHSKALVDGYMLAGKTGTAQNPHGEPHAWFLGYGKYNDTILSIVVLVENGGHGGEVSAPIARKAFDFYFSTYN